MMGSWRLATPLGGAGRKDIAKEAATDLLPNGLPYKKGVLLTKNAKLNAGLLG